MVARWEGERRRLSDGNAYDYLETHHKKKLTLVRVGVDAPAAFDFSVRQEGAHDRFFKRVGVCREIEVRDPGFDDRLYVESDDYRVEQLLKQREPVRAALLDAFASLDTRLGKLKRIRGARGRVWAEFVPRKGEESPALLERTIVPVLAGLSRHLRQIHSRAGEHRDSFVWRAAILLSVSTASALLGLFGLMRALSGRTDILEPFPLFRISALLGALFLVAFLMLILRVLGRSSRTHLVLIEALLVGGFGFVMSAFALAREADITFDRSVARPQRLSDITTEHRITRGRRSTRHHYYLHTMDWNPNHVPRQLRLEIDAPTFHALEGKQVAIVWTRAGALRYEWVEKIEAEGW